jgi:hypothetical protein
MIRYLLILAILFSSYVMGKEENNLIVGTWQSCGGTTHQILKDGSLLQVGSGSVVTFYKNNRYELFSLNTYTDLGCKNLKFRSGMKSKGKYKIIRKTDVVREEGPVYEIKLTGWYAQGPCNQYFIITNEFILPADVLCKEVTEKNLRYRKEDLFKFYKVKSPTSNE